MSVPSIPFTILAMAPFNPVPEVSYNPRVVLVDPADLDGAFEELGPSLSISVPDSLVASGWLDLKLSRMEGFHPDGLIEDTPYLRNLLEARDFIRDSLDKGAGAEEIYNRLNSWPDLPVKINYAPSGKSAPAKSSSSVDDILSMVAVPGADPGSGGSAGSPGDPAAWADDIERALVQLMVNIFSNDDFRRFEAPWRGLELLVKQGLGEQGDKVRLKLCSVSTAALAQSLEALQDDLIADPPSVILVDLSLDASPMAFDLLDRLAGLAENLLAPVVAQIDERFFHLSRWEDLHKLPYIPNHLEQPQYAKWRRLQGLPAADWLGVMANGFLARHPYGGENKPRLVEFMEGKNLFSGPVWALGCLMARRVRESGWPTGFTVSRENFLTDLGLKSDDGPPRSTAAEISEERIHQFVDAGIMPLAGPPGKAEAFIAKSATVSGNSFSYQLLLSRLISLVLWCKDNFESGMGPSETEINLLAAFGEYWTSTGHEPPADMNISVTETEPGQPFMVSISLTPGGEILPSGQKVELTLGW
jgi:type VI secretion system protein ImpC